ncbi:MAG: hypothetical protein M1835_002483 [Candelina submexicana]|nr:MAG: hypothetical protein M1835_002483 [Candelina submexicana]
MGRAVPIADQSRAAGHGDLPSRPSDAQAADVGPTYESYTFRKAESIDPQQKRSWARYTINETPIPMDELKQQVQKQKQKKISVWDQYKKLEARRQTMIDSFIEEKKVQEKDKRFERKLVSVTTEERKVGRSGFETASIHIILKRQLRPIVTTQRVGGATLHHDTPKELNGSLPPRQHHEQDLPAQPAFDNMNMRPNVARPAGNQSDFREQFGPMPPRPGPPAGISHQGPNPQPNRFQQPNTTSRDNEPQIIVVDDRLPPPPPLPPQPQAGQSGPPRQAPHPGLRHQPSQPLFQPAPQPQRPQSRNANQFAIPQQHQTMPSQQRPQPMNANQFTVSQQQSMPQQRAAQPVVVPHQQPRPQSRNGQPSATLPHHVQPQSRNEQHTRGPQQAQGMPRGSVSQGPQRGYSVRKPSAKQRRVEQWLESDDEGLVDSDELTEDGTVITEATSLDDEFDVRPIKESARRGSLNRRHSRSSYPDHGGRHGPVYREHSRKRPVASSDRNGSISPHYRRGGFEIQPEVNRARHPPTARRQSFAVREERPAFVPHRISYESDRYDARDLPRLTRGPPYGRPYQAPQRRLPEAPYSADFLDERQQRYLQEAQLQQDMDRLEALHLHEMEAAEQWDRSPILDQDPRRFPNRVDLGSRRLPGGYFPTTGRDRFDFRH